MSKEKLLGPVTKTEESVLVRSLCFDGFVGLIRRNVFRIPDVVFPHPVVESFWSIWMLLLKKKIKIIRLEGLDQKSLESIEINNEQ
jgi:hypothetical protein